VEVPGWQLPLIIVGLVLVISLPSMFVAALKLRQRTLGPILEGSGWAINGRARISVPLGKALTRMAVLPPGASYSPADPYGGGDGAPQGRRAALLAALLLLAGFAIWVRWDHNQRGRYFWENAPFGTTG
jgi:hypothetical protein